MISFKILLEYDGTRYSGWQEQKNARTVMGEIRKAAQEVLGERLEMQGAGRTDAGVHALGQVASFRTDRTWAPTDWTRALNAVLPEDISVRSTELMPDSFHAQHAACGKLYEYRILNRPERPTIERRYVWHVYRPLDDASMRQAASTLIGSHDFSSFEGALSDNEDPICHLQQLSVAREGDHLVIQAYANRFLKQMARAIVGTLVEVGHAKRPPNSLADILAAKDRTAAGRTAPPQGLFLVRVDYQYFADSPTDDP